MSVLTIKTKDKKSFDALALAKQVDMDYIMTKDTIKFKSDKTEKQNDVIVKIMGIVSDWQLR